MNNNSVGLHLSLLLSSLVVCACAREEGLGDAPSHAETSDSEAPEAVRPQVEADDSEPASTSEVMVQDGGSSSGPSTVLELCTQPEPPSSGPLTIPRAEPTCVGKVCGAECNPCNGRPGCTPPPGDHACNYWGGCFPVLRDPNSTIPTGTPPPMPISVVKLCAPQTYPSSGGLTLPMREYTCTNKECGETCDPCVTERENPRPNCAPLPDTEYACNTWGGCFPVIR